MLYSKVLTPRLSAQVPEVEPHPVHVDLAEVHAHGGGDLAQVGALVVVIVTACMTA